MKESNKFDNNNTAKYNSQTNTELCITRKETKTISLYFCIYDCKSHTALYMSNYCALSESYREHDQILAFVSQI